MNESIMLIMIFTLNKRETGFFFYPKFHIMHPMFRLIQINSTNLHSYPRRFYYSPDMIFFNVRILTFSNVITSLLVLFQTSLSALTLQKGISGGVSCPRKQGVITSCWRDYSYSRKQPSIIWRDYSNSLKQPSIIWRDYSYSWKQPSIIWRAYSYSWKQSSIIWRNYSYFRKQPSIIWRDYSYSQKKPSIIPPFTCIPIRPIGYRVYRDLRRIFSRLWGQFRLKQNLQPQNDLQQSGLCRRFLVLI